MFFHHHSLTCINVCSMQYRAISENLCNVGAVFASTGYYQKINRSKIKIAEKRCCSDDNALGFFLCNVVWRQYDYCLLSGGNMGQYCTGFLPVQRCPKSIKSTLNSIFVFPVQCCLEPLGQYSTKFLHGQYCPKSIKTILNKIFSCALLSGASRTKLHRVFTCAMLSQEKTKLNRNFSCTMFPVVSWITLHNVFTSAMLSQEY